MGRKPQMSTTCLIGSIVITLLGTTAVGVSVQGTELKEDVKNGSQTVTRGHSSAVHTSIRYSISKGDQGKAVVKTEQTVTTISAVSNSTLLPSEIDQVNEGLDVSKTEEQSTVLSTRNHTSNPEASLHSVNKPLEISPTRSVLKQEDTSNRGVAPSSSLQEETQTEHVPSSSTSYPLSSTDSGSTSIIPQRNHYSTEDGASGIRGGTDRVSQAETRMKAITERIALAASSEVEFMAKKPDDLSAQATALHSHYEPEGDSSEKQAQHTREGESEMVADFENEDGILTNTGSIAEKTELYSIPKEAINILALNSQLLGYNTDVYQNSPKHMTSLRDNEQEISTVKDTIEVTTTPPIDTTTHKRTYRRRRRRRKGQTSESSRRLPNESYQGGEGVHTETLPSIPPVENIEQESTTDQPLTSVRNRYGMRKIKYTAHTTTEDYRAETLATSESAHDEPNTDVEKPRGRARSQNYRRRRPRYRVKVRRRNNHTLINDENVTWENGQSKEINHFSTVLDHTESTQSNVFEETTESLPSQQEAENFPVTTLRTHIIQAINELQQINTLIASRKDDISNSSKNDALPQPVILQSRPLTQNSLEVNASQYEPSFLRNLNLSEQELGKLFHSLLNRNNARTPLNAALLPSQVLYQEHFYGTAQNHQRFGNFTNNYEEDFSPAASTMDKNANSIQERSRQSNLYVGNDTQVYLLDGIPVRELVERDLVTSEQQRQYPRRPTNTVSNICQNSTIPEIIDCIRNIDQRKSPGRKGSYNEVIKSATRDFPTVPQANDLKTHRSSRNSTASFKPALADQRSKGSLRNNRDFVSPQLYSKPTEQGISVKSTTQYSTNLSPSNRNRKTISSTPKLGLTKPQGGAGGKPGASTPNSISTSLSGALKVGGRMLLSQLQKLRNVILQIPSQLGRLSAGAGNQKQAQKSKSSSPSTSLFTPRSSSSFIWR